LWPLFVLLLLAIRAPAETAQAGGADKPRAPGAVNRPDGAVPKPAWEWSVEERLAARFDPEAVEAKEVERKANDDEARKQSPDGRLPLDELLDQMTGPEPVTITLDGSKTPELYLPGELFWVLIDRGLQHEQGSPDPGKYWARMEGRAAALGFGRDFWDRLENIAAPYVTFQRPDRLRSVEQKGAGERKEEAQRRCRARAQALRAAEAEFGREAFLRLLYEAVAPDAYQVQILGPEPVDYQQHAEEARFQEGGCL
jgi:hypothetical protein